MKQPFARRTELDRTDASGGSHQQRLRPALLAAYRDVSSLRYDYPLILSEGGGSEGCLRSLSGVVDGVLREIAPPGAAGERLRQHVIRLELRIRALAAYGARGSLAELWDLAARELLSASDEASPALLKDSLTCARSALQVDGRVVDCSAEASSEVLEHAWATVAEERGRVALEEIGALESKLFEILKVDFLNSEEGRSPERLERSVGGPYEDAFDFGAWSRILAEGSRRSPLPESRRRRISGALAVLGSQRFFASAGVTGRDRPPAHRFAFRSCELALAAFQERLPEMVELVKAIAIAKLEIENGYRESRHDEFFRRFDETSLAPEDLGRFPSYLVCLRAKDCTSQERAAVFEILSSELPMKILVQNDDILGGALRAEGPGAVASGTVHLAGMAVALGDTYVLQAASSSLYQVRDRIRKGLFRPGPALFSIFCGSGETLPHLPPYLRAAAATQSRAFPTFRYDPDAGESWASRLALDDNPQPEVDWPLTTLTYQDEALQRVSEEVAFTLVDFAAADRRCAGHVEPVPCSEWSEDMVPAWRYLELEEEEAHGKVPYVLTVDADDVLHRRVVDRALIRAARRCNRRWRALQQLGGIGAPNAPKPSDADQDAPEDEALVRPEEPTAAPAGATAQEAPPPPGETEVARDADEPYIETPRCTTCDECTQINPRMFAYDENRQAYIADPNAGTYRDLVEAAESCQVSIIHPGKPGNPKEPGLPELIGRAEPFR